MFLVLITVHVQVSYVACFCLFIFRVPRLHQRLLPQLHGVLSHCSKLVQFSPVITVTFHREPDLFWHFILGTGHQHPRWLEKPHWDKIIRGKATLVWLESVFNLVLDGFTFAHGVPSLLSHLIANVLLFSCFVLFFPHTPLCRLSSRSFRFLAPLKSFQRTAPWSITAWMYLLPTFMNTQTVWFTKTMTPTAAHACSPSTHGWADEVKKQNSLLYWFCTNFDHCSKGRLFSSTAKI